MAKAGLGARFVLCVRVDARDGALDLAHEGPIINFTVEFEAVHDHVVRVTLLRDEVAQQLRGRSSITLSAAISISDDLQEGFRGVLTANCPAINIQRRWSEHC